MAALYQPALRPTLALIVMAGLVRATYCGTAESRVAQAMTDVE
jgi:hypothetical protein